MKRVYIKFLYNIKEVSHVLPNILCLDRVSHLGCTGAGGSYGYEISQTIKLIANIKESTLYPILKKLEASGFLTTYSREFQGRMRKYYSLTNRGVEQLITLKEEWTLYTDTVNGIIEGSIRHDKN